MDITINQSNISDIVDLDACDYEVSTGIVLSNENGFVFGLQNSDRWKSRGDQTEVGLVGIGGKLEAGESILQGVMRESQEEIGVFPSLSDSDMTYLIRHDKVEKIVLQGYSKPRPYLINILQKTEPGRKPYTVVVTFRGETTMELSPRDLSGILIMDSATLLSLSSGPKTLKYLLDHSATLLCREIISENMWVKPHGTAEAIIRLLVEGIY